MRFYDPTNHLRFIERDGKKILQQYWKERFGREVSDEWRDVPLETDESTKSKDAKP